MGAPRVAIRELAIRELYDPTNGSVGGLGLVRVAVARHPTQAIPIGGTWSGVSDDFIGLDVKVTIVEAADDSAVADVLTRFD